MNRKLKQMKMAQNTPLNVNDSAVALLHLVKNEPDRLGAREAEKEGIAIELADQIAIRRKSLIAAMVAGDRQLAVKEETALLNAENLLKFVADGQLDAELARIEKEEAEKLRGSSAPAPANCDPIADEATNA